MTKPNSSQPSGLVKGLMIAAIIVGVIGLVVGVLDGFSTPIFVMIMGGLSSFGLLMSKRQKKKEGED